ncbi:MAG: UDP-N-acetylmuramate dehydrogenase [Clostridiales bacterium]|nr:UDP-N-acetylmuramate dehydrogenase [Clostridiales bacterium]
MAGTGNVMCDEPMSRHTTFRVGGPADFLVTPAVGSLPGVADYCRQQDIPYLIIGNGSNLLCSDEGVDGVVIEIGKAMADISVESGAIKAGAGALLSAVAAEAARSGLAGMEFASGIPGSVGGAVAMNAGAYGGEMKDILSSVTILTPEGGIKDIPVEELSLSYRHSAIPEKGYIVLAAAFSLKEDRQESILSRMDELKEKRISKQPLEYPSAGSTFKRPEGYFAGKLIEDAGLRGYTVGGAQVSEKHCGFVINKGDATAADIRALMEHIQATVKNMFGVELEPEVKFIGRF